MKKKLIFWGILIIINLLAVAGGWAVYRHFANKPQGLQLNAQAWGSSYQERDLPIPELGPREGFWGRRLWEHTTDMPFGKVPVNFKLEPLLNFDRFGMQHFKGRSDGTTRLLIIGGSVALGAYASTSDKAYFDLMGRLLADSAGLAEVTVLAGGGWTSKNEIVALNFALERVSADIVLFLNGLNDLTQLKDRPYEQRVETYLENMGKAAAMIQTGKLIGVFALQPFLLDKIHKTPLERRIITLYDTAPLSRSYPQLREGLRRLAREEGLFFIDSSDALNSAAETTFCDLWHFADPGHELLALRLATGLSPLLVKRMAQQEPTAANAKRESPANLSATAE